MEQKVSYDALLKSAGGFGRFQAYLLVWHIMVLFLVASQMGYMIFGKIRPTFSCEGSTNFTTNESSCAVLPNPYFYGLAAEWKIQSISGLNILNDVLTVQMIGMMLAPPTVGYASDRFGRRKIGIIAYTMLVLCGLAQGLCNTPLSFMATRFFVGFFLTGFASIEFIIFSELMPNKWRTTADIGSWPIGYAFLALLAIGFPHWRNLIWAIHIPVPIAFILFLLLPESPKWLLQRGQRDEAARVIKRIAAINHVQDFEPLSALLKQDHDLGGAGEKSGSFLYLFRDLKTALTTVTLYYCWIATAFVYFALTFNIGSLQGNPAINTMILMGARVVVSALIPLVDSTIKKAGRKHIYTFGLCVVAAGLSLLLAVKAVDEFPDRRSVVQYTALTCILFTQLMWSMVMVLAAESFPTELRNVSYGTCMAVTRIGGILGPYVIDLELRGFTVLPYAIFLGAVVVNTVTMLLFIPETKGKPLPDLE